MDKNLEEGGKNGGSGDIDGEMKFLEMCRQIDAIFSVLLLRIFS